MQIAHQPMEPIDHPSAVCGQLVSPVGKQPQHRAMVLADDPGIVDSAGAVMGVTSERYPAGFLMGGACATIWLSPDG